MNRFFLLIISLCLAMPALGQAQLEIIKLRYRSADQVLPQVTPFVENTGAITGSGYQIFLRASSRNREQIKEIINSLDTPLRRLMITVKQDGGKDISRSGVGISGNVGDGNTRIIQRSTVSPGTTIEMKRGDDSLKARVYGTEGNSSDKVSQQVQVLEGGEAFIQVGQSLPIPLRQVVLTSTGAIVSETMVYRDIGSGFYAAPTVSGDYVTLDISPTRDSQSHSIEGAVNIQRLSTKVSGRLGEWIELGGTNLDNTNENSNTTQYSSTTRKEKQRVLLRIEELPH
jgi:type II secretory pathway component GspD/PulD (secretin)